AELSLCPASRETVQASLKECVLRRRQTQPVGPNAGSIFKNPPGDYAGRLIEDAGLKGYRLGDAQISTKHANFMVNRGQARASDVAQLIDFARNRVQKQFGIRLDLEIEMVGEWQ
ncbi:MAG: UDP-N-acetylenolpyruvoylglucosamine reductase, partial [Dehalococcoidia bacterium]|nr:UDP-N-acetylenolpyruvoylglucosamine reductase [Dehalococcoidia bacterium]